MNIDAACTALLELASALADDPDCSKNSDFINVIARLRWVARNGSVSEIRKAIRETGRICKEI